MKILYVCRSNFARSPMAEALTYKLTEHRASSAGLFVEKRYLNHRLEEFRNHTMPVMKEAGIDLSRHVIRRLSPKIISDADLVITMIPVDLWPKHFSKGLRNFIYWPIPDPRGHGRDSYRNVRDLLDEKIASLTGAR